MIQLRHKSPHTGVSQLFCFLSSGASPLRVLLPSDCSCSFPLCLFTWGGEKEKACTSCNLWGNLPKCGTFKKEMLNACCCEKLFSSCADTLWSSKCSTLSWNVHWMRRVKSYKWHFYGLFQGPHNRSSDSTSRCPSSSVTPALSMSPFTASINLLHL